jgi:uncharacterized protein
MSASAADHSAYAQSTHLAFVLLAMGLLCFLFFICALRTNIVFCLIFASLFIAFGILSGSYWQVSNGNTVLAGRLQIAGGAVIFFTCFCGWWILAAIMLAALDFPFQIPGERHHSSSPPRK